MKDVRSEEQEDSMESFLFAETFRHYYLLFAPDKALDFDGVVFNTAAHPLRRTWKDLRASGLLAQSLADLLFCGPPKRREVIAFSVLNRSNC